MFLSQLIIVTAYTYIIWTIGRSGVSTSVSTSWLEPNKKILKFEYYWRITVLIEICYVSFRLYIQVLLYYTRPSSLRVRVIKPEYGHMV